MDRLKGTVRRRGKNVKEEKKRRRSLIPVIFGILILLAGVGYALFPWLQAWYFNRVQADAMDMWLNGDENDDDPYGGADDSGLDSDALWEESVNRLVDSEDLRRRMEGIITIGSINLRAPILHGATKANLDLAICHLSGTPEMGLWGNYVLAGHKSRVRGRHFSRLNEVKVGDLVIVENRRKNCYYKVTQVFSVRAEDTWVMDQPSDKKLITLITCDYTMTPIGRIIVRGELWNELEKP